MARIAADLRFGKPFENCADRIGLQLVAQHGADAETFVWLRCGNE